MSLKTIIFVIFICFSIINTSAQTKQPGFVKEYKGKQTKSPLANVEIVISNASSTVSDKGGKFLLHFHTLVPGKKVNIRRIEKNGYEIFNKEALEQWNINPEEPFTIVMVKSSKIKQLRDTYSRVSYESYEKQYQAELSKLEDNKKKGILTENQLKAEIIKLREEYDRLLDNIDNYIDRFVHIDLSALSSEEQNIINLVKNGQIDEAIKKYECLDLVTKYENISAENNKITHAQETLKTILDKNNESLNDLWKSIKRQLDTYMLSGGSENYRKVQDITFQLIKSQSTSIWMKLELINYLKNQDILRVYESINIDTISDISEKVKIKGNYALTLTLCEKYQTAIKLAEDNAFYAEEHEDIESLINNLNILLVCFHSIYSPDKETLISEKLKKIEQSPKFESECSLNAKLSLYSALAGHYQGIGKLGQFLTYAKLAFDISSENYNLLPTTHNKHEYIKGLVMYSTSLRAIEKCSECISLTTEALPSLEQMFKSQKRNYYIFYLTALRNIAESYFFIEDYTSSEHYFIASLDATSQAKQYNLNNYSPKTEVDLYNNLGYLYYTTGLHSKSECAYKQALQIGVEHYNENPNDFFSLLSLFRPQINICTLYKSLQKYDVAMKYGLEAHSSIKKLYDNFPDAFAKEFVTLLNDLAYISMKQHNLTDAINYVEKSIEIDANNTNSYNTKGEILLLMGDNDAAKQTFDTIINIDPTFFEKNDSMLIRFQKNN